MSSDVDGWAKSITVVLVRTALTNGAAAGETPIALMTRAGHANMSTTQTYLHLAGVVFPEEAQRLEQRFAGGDGPAPDLVLDLVPNSENLTSPDVA